MIVRRIPLLATSVVTLAALGLAARETPEPTAAVFATMPSPWMPAVSAPGDLTSTWFCPGVPASGEEDTGGEIIIANASAEPMQARVTLLAGPGEAVQQAVTVPPFQRSVIDAAASITTPYASAVVEIEGGGGLVEQKAIQEAGTSVAPCANSPASSWYLAEGFTAEDSSEQLVLSNPFDESAIVDIGFATADGSRVPLEGQPVPARSVKVIDMDSIAARDEPEVAVKVVATRGNLVVGRAQLYDGGGRLGYSMTLASPTLRSQWWFANGAKGADVTERFSLYNPTENDVEVTPVYLGIAGGSDVLIEPIVVPARQVVTYTSDNVAGLPEGRHAVVFGTTDFSQSIVVERAVTRTIDDIPTTSVLIGGLSRPEDAYVANTWMLAAGPGEPTSDALAIYNTVQADATVTVQAVTADGVVTVPSLAEVALPAGALITIPLTEPEVLDNQLIIRSTAPVFVERSLPRVPTAQGRSATWAVPVLS